MLMETYLLQLECHKTMEWEETYLQAQVAWNIKDNDLTEEEQQRIEKVNNENQERKKGLYAKQIEEEDQKAQKKANAAKALADWK